MESLSGTQNEFGYREDMFQCTHRQVFMNGWFGCLLERHSVLHEVCGVRRQWDVARQTGCSVCSADKRVIGEGTQ